MHKLNSRVEELINLYNFQLFASNNKGNSSHQKLQNCWVVKRLMSPYIFFGKVLSFSKISPKLSSISSSNFHSYLKLLC